MGQLRLFAGNFAPIGFAFADGQMLSISDYPELFGVLGTTYGGDGVSTFALPDLRGRTPIGAGSGVGLTNRLLGASVGAESVSLAVSNLPSHSHAFSVVGDYNFNGIVDAADYVVWLKGLGTTYTQNDHALWRSHFGQTAVNGTEFEGTTVPEPACSLLTATIAGALLQFCGRKKEPAAAVGQRPANAGRIEVAVQRRPA